MSDSQANNKRIAKNTLALYFRMILTMIVSLYTSRVVLATLGVEDYGIFNVVGGVVAMFSMISSSLSGAISRFTNFEMGKGNKDRLNMVFCTSLNVQFIICSIVFVLAETIGLWFLCNKMVIPAERMDAAQWVFHCSVISFMINLISVPYNASIIAHERMKAFAYVSIIEVVLKLLIVYLLVISPFDKLKLYAVLLLCISLTIRYIYGRYCSKNFEECHYSPQLDRSLLKEMFSYSGWTFIGTSAALFRTQGVNILINLFCGPAVNAARGISTQVNNAVQQFISNFSTALNPQIIKNYASKNFEYCLKLVNQGARLSFYMFLLLSLPFLIETEYILSLWLTVVPEHTITFVRLTLIYSLIGSLSTTLIRLATATGDVRNYQLVVGSLLLLNFPVDYVLMKWYNMPPEGTLVVAIVIQIMELFVRMYMVTKISPFKPLLFFRNVVINAAIVTVISLVLPLLVHLFSCSGVIRFVLVLGSSIFSTAVAIIYSGCTKEERKFVFSKAKGIWMNFIK